MTSRLQLSLGLLAALLCGCSAIRVERRAPAVSEETRGRIARLGCGDTESGARMLAAHPQRDSLRVQREPEECAESLTWMARWMGESFVGWGDSAPRDSVRIARFALLRGGPQLRVYMWPSRSSRESLATGGTGFVYEIDLRRRGEGIVGVIF